MNCQTIQDQLADYLGCELDAVARAAFDRHVETCANCRADVGALTETVAAMAHLDIPPLAPAALPPHRVGWRPPLSYAAVLLVGLGVGWSVRPDGATVSPPDTSPVVRESPDTPSGVHPGWVNAVVASSSDPRETPFARNAIKLIRAFNNRRVK